MRLLVSIGALIMVVLSACATPAANQQVVKSEQQTEVTVFKAPN
jgi:hypothetical protein